MSPTQSTFKYTHTFSCRACHWISEWYLLVNNFLETHGEREREREDIKVCKMSKTHRIFHTELHPHLHLTIAIYRYFKLKNSSIETIAVLNLFYNEILNCVRSVNISNCVSVFSMSLWQMVGCNTVVAVVGTCYYLYFNRLLSV